MAGAASGTAFSSSVIPPPRARGSGSCRSSAGYPHQQAHMTVPSRRSGQSRSAIAARCRFSRARLALTGLIGVLGVPLPMSRTTVSGVRCGPWACPVAAKCCPTGGGGPGLSRRLLGCGCRQFGAGETLPAGAPDVAGLSDRAEEATVVVAGLDEFAEDDEGSAGRVEVGCSCHHRVVHAHGPAGIPERGMAVLIGDLRRRARQSGRRTSTESSLPGDSFQRTRPGACAPSFSSG